MAYAPIVYHALTARRIKVSMHNFISYLRTPVVNKIVGKVVACGAPHNPFDVAFHSFYFKEVVK